MQGIRSYTAALGIGITVGKITVERQAGPLCPEVTNGDGKHWRESLESETSERRKLRGEDGRQAGRLSRCSGAGVDAYGKKALRPAQTCLGEGAVGIF